MNLLLTHPLPSQADLAMLGQRVLLRAIDWNAYQKIGDALQDRHIRLTYDRGNLEIMVVSCEHERFKELLSFLVITFARFYRRKIIGAGSFTHLREDLEKGLEPDSCFYCQNLAAIQGKRNIDLERDPPPDLAIEIEISRSALDRMGIYAALKVPEVWRFDGETLQVLVLKKKRYVVSPRSRVFPEVPPEGLPLFLHLGIAEDYLTLGDAVEAWLQKLPPSKPKKARD